VLVGTTPGWPASYPMPAQSIALLAAGRGLSAEDRVRRNVANALSADTVAHRPALVERVVAHVLARPTERMSWSGQAGAGARYVSHYRQGRISARTLVLHGTADTVVDPRNAQLLAERIPDARLRYFPGLGHLLPWEDPDGFVDAVTAFLLHGPPRRGTFARVE
jgi:pimeloyl-ACP methyl ester carboxylesterase